MRGSRRLSPPRMAVARVPRTAVARTAIPRVAVARMAVARMAVVVVALLAVAGCVDLAGGLAGRPGPEAGLLRGRRPWRSEGVSHLDRLTDGIAAAPDDPPRTDLTSTLASPQSFVIYDLGQDAEIGCVAIEADGDDRYELALSRDGVAFAPLWTAGATGDLGLQPRAARDVHGVGRYLRLSASGGDGVYAVAELSVAGRCPARWPPALALQEGTPVEDSARIKAWAFAACALVYIFAYRPRAPDFIKLLVAVPLGLATALCVQLAELWPPPPALRAVLLAAVAIPALAGALRFAGARRRGATRRRSS